MFSRKVKTIIYSVFSVSFFLFLYAPVFVLIIFSFNDSTSMTFPLKGFTLKWYGELFARGGAVEAIRNSLIVGGVTAILATMLGILAALALTRHRFRGRSFFQYLMIIPMIIPFIIMGVSMLILFNSIGLSLSLLTVTLGHTLIALPYTTLVITARLIGLDPALEEAAMDLGADELTTFTEITLPQMFPGVLAAALLAFTVSFEDASLTYFIIGYEPTLPIYIFGYLRYPRMLPMLVATSVLTLSLALIFATLSTIARRRIG